MATLDLVNINKIQPNGVQAVFDLNLHIDDQEFIIFVGPSGCGKSTTLRMIAGLEDITSGDFLIDGVKMNNISPKDRGISMVFQSYALYPHMTVYDNMAFALQIRRMSREEISKRVAEAAKILGLEPFLSRFPRQLSGGQCQRVALGRAIVQHAGVFLLDEPLSNLDAKLRGSMRKELMQLHERLNATFVYVTHDQIEALTLATRIVVMKDGYVQQIASPKEMFDNPENLFVAGFIGTPPMNFADGYIDENLEYFVHESGMKFKLTEHQHEILGNYAGKQVKFAVRAEYVYIDDANLQKFADSTFDLKVDYTEFLGAYNLIYGLFGDQPIISKVYQRNNIVDKELKACFDMDKVHFFDIETTKRIRQEVYL